jgi:hypothetical protein
LSARPLVILNRRAGGGRACRDPQQLRRAFERRGLAVDLAVHRLGVIPAGSGNDFAWQHDVPRQLDAAVARIARADDPRPVVPDRRRKSIGAERTFGRDLRTVSELAPELAKACAAVGGRLERGELAARTVTVKVKYADFRIVTRSATPPNPVADALELWPVAERLAFEVARPPGAVRLIGVAASGLIPRAARVVQGPLFGEPV